MPHLPLFVKESESWKRIETLASKGIFPHCVALSAPEDIHLPLARETAELLLCHNGKGGDDCLSCRAWSGEEHPDLIKGGEPGKAPSIDMCRDLIRVMSYRPVVSRKRVAIVFSADEMLLPSANSLLKLAEEPPEFVCILFLLSSVARFLPTLRSRSWTVSLHLRQEEERCPLPDTEEKWSRWTEKNSGSDLEEILLQFDPWIRYLISNGEYNKAGRVERLRLFLESKRLSRTMALDSIVLALKEGIVFEHLFGNIW